MDPAYLDRLVEAYTALQKRERRTDIDFAEITRRVTASLGKPMLSQTVGRWMKGKVQPREPSERKAFAEALGVSFHWLFYADQTKKPTGMVGESANDVDVGAVPLTQVQKARAVEKTAAIQQAKSVKRARAKPPRKGKEK